MRFQRTRLIVSFIVAILFMLFVFIRPAILVKEILMYVEQSDGRTLVYGIGLCVALFISEFSKIIFGSLLWAVNLRTAIRVKGAFSMLAFQKIITLRTLSDVTVGEFYISQLIRVLRKKTIKVTDKRVRTMNEVLTCIKLIKMHAWEESFEKKITDIRKEEKLLLEKAGYIQSVNCSLTALVPFLATILTFIAHTALQLPLQPSTAFTFIALFNSIRMTMGLLPSSVKAVAEAKVALKRLKRILMIKNPKPYLIQNKELSAALVMNKASLSWSSSAPDRSESPLIAANRVKSDTNLQDTKLTLQNITFTLFKGNLLGVCGNVGSGKTSLISSILEQMHLQSGSISVNGTLAYVSQQAWIFHATVQDNILMGETFDQARYDRVIHACCLKPDLASLPYDDQTEIGERGLNLSGGQKQRVSLARAVYSNRDIFLLDNTLSAVDAHVGKHIYEECIKKELKGKTVILVTHQLQYLEFCDEVLLLENGSIKEAGTHKALMKTKGRYAHLINNYQSEQSNMIYDLNMVAMVVLCALKSYTFTKVTLHASSKLHDSMFRMILASPMCFFDTTPTGRIVNRFSKDLDEIDAVLPFIMENFLQFCLMVICTILTMCIVFPYFLIAVVALGAIFAVILYIFQRSIREMKRRENVSRSPASLTTSIIQGLSTIHAYDKRAQYTEKFQMLNDNNSSHFLLFNCGTRWLSFWLNGLSATITLIVALFVLTGMLQYVVRLSTEVEAKFTSVERLQEYITGCVSEAPHKVEDFNIPSGWPQEGAITFQNYSMRYRENTQIVLNQLNLTINPQEKLGIVGRTGSEVRLEYFSMKEVTLQHLSRKPEKHS
ncbi:hypothetical protein HF521_014092 [Silurus meridionalis]|uniref:Uncharacterized protein n=1 Tax=Silurus meridionalis TaxID=175797 RepID=A0A8T0A8H1_SILME|nr:hypothetical protein HF521_014092 [Silurus meridionalis]